jgi:SAM-dependent methyltransferase
LGCNIWCTAVGRRSLRDPFPELAVTSSDEPADLWRSGDAYEPYIGRWSRPAARDFVRWLALPPGAWWLDVGCGTGALTAAILADASPAAVLGVEPSDAYRAVARQRVRDERVRFEPGDAGALPAADGACDAVVSGLVLNFVSDPAAGLAEMARVARSGGTVAAYVWDYAGRMELIRCFWDAAVALRPQDRERDEGRLFPLCRPERLYDLFTAAGLADVEARSIDVPTVFHDFDDYWRPFLGGQGPAPAYAMALDDAERDALRERLRSTLPTQNDGSIRLTARAWAVRGRSPAR